jgi:hypothetical protein
MNKNVVDFTTKTNLSGEFKLKVIEDGKVIKEQRQKNLILDSGLDLVATSYFSGLNNGLFGNIHAGTGNSPNFRDLAPSTYSQTGNVITRVSGTASFVANDINQSFLFETGEQGKILAITSATQVTVDISQSVTGKTLKIYNTQRQFLDNWLAQSYTETPEGDSGTLDYQTDPNRPVYVYNSTALFDIADVENTTITELGVTAGDSATDVLYSRVLLDDPVVLGTGQQLAATYSVTFVGDFTEQTNVDVNIAGWAIEYDLDSIVDNGDDTALVIMTPDAGDDHHYQIGDEIIIQDAVRTRIPITSIASTATEFTVTTSTAHGFSTGDSIIIDATTPAVYSSTWVVASTPTTTTLTITSAVNAGAGSGGNVRDSNPVNWWNGTHTVTGIATNQVTIDATSGRDDAGDGGVVTNDARCTVYNKTMPEAMASTSNEITNPLTGNYIQSEIPFAERAFDSWCHGSVASQRPYFMFYTQKPVSIGGFGVEADISGLLSATEPLMEATAYVPGSHQREYFRTLTVAELNSDRIQTILFNKKYGNNMNEYSGVWLVFNQPQKKKNTYTLELKIRYYWGRELI